MPVGFVAGASARFRGASVACDDGRVDDLIAFLRARLEQDERPVATARMRREIAAKRAILEWHQPEWADYVDGDGIERATHECAECEPPGTPDNWPCRTVRALVAVYSGHPAC